MNNELLKRQRNIERMRKRIGGIPEDDHTTKKFQDTLKKVKQIYQEAQNLKGN